MLRLVKGGVPYEKGVVRSTSDIDPDTHTIAITAFKPDEPDVNYESVVSMGDRVLVNRIRLADESEMFPIVGEIIGFYSEGNAILIRFLRPKNALLHSIEDLRERTGCRLLYPMKPKDVEEVYPLMGSVKKSGDCSHKHEWVGEVMIRKGFDEVGTAFEYFGENKMSPENTRKLQEIYQELKSE